METLEGSNRHKGLALFKSYYVVWKPKWKKITNSRYIQFKSYYVVWKLRWEYQTCARHISLNRTMQYGNPCPIVFSPSQRASLNRTMQYGNCGFSSIIFFSPAKFKSYYVVWKLHFDQVRPSLNTRLNRTMQYGNLPGDFLPRIVQVV